MIEIGAAMPTAITAEIAIVTTNAAGIERTGTERRTERGGRGGNVTVIMSGNGGNAENGIAMMIELDDEETNGRSELSCAYLTIVPEVHHPQTGGGERKLKLRRRLYPDAKRNWSMPESWPRWQCTRARTTLSTMLTWAKSSHGIRSRRRKRRQE